MSEIYTIKEDHVMVDLETLGTKPFAPILSIGACRFPTVQPVGDDTICGFDTFYQAIDLQSCLDVGLKINAGTLQWWLQQSTQAIFDAFQNSQAIPLPQALDNFTTWLNSRPDLIYGNSTRFDMGILEAAYTACGKVVPWEHYNERDYRTIKNLPQVKKVLFERQGTYHNALDDAISQAVHLQKIFKELNIS